MFCKSCGKEINDNAVVCIHCGCATDGKTINTVQEKELSMVAYVLLGLLFCAHRLYAGQKHGVLYLVLCIIAYATSFIGVGFAIAIVLLIFEIIDISKAAGEHRIIDRVGNVKTI
jgi:uncharacterized membrane protein YvbJ